MGHRDDQVAVDGQRINGRLDMKLIDSIATLDREIHWLENMINYRIAIYFHQNEAAILPESPDLSADESYYAQVVREHGLNEQERLIILTALVPHCRPSVLDVFFAKNDRSDRVYTEFGGIKGAKHSGFIPTGETAAFIIAGRSLQERFDLLPVFDTEHALYKENILSIGHTNNNEPLWSGELIVSQEFLAHVTRNQPYEPRFSPEFPAKKLESKLDWEDLVFPQSLLMEINQLRSWIAHESKVMQDMKLGKYLKQGYRALFYGPPGTGKSMTAAMLGKSEGMPVYRVDLSAVVSKYIGETEYCIM